MFTTTKQVTEVDPAAFEPVGFRVTDDGFAEFPVPADVQDAYDKAVQIAEIEEEPIPVAPQPTRQPLADIEVGLLLRAGFQMKTRDAAKAALFNHLAERYTA